MRQDDDGAADAGADAHKPARRERAAAEPASEVQLALSTGARRFRGIFPLVEIS